MAMKRPAEPRHVRTGREAWTIFVFFFQERFQNGKKSDPYSLHPCSRGSLRRTHTPMNVRANGHSGAISDECAELVMSQETLVSRWCRLLRLYDLNEPCRAWKTVPRGMVRGSN